MRHTKIVATVGPASSTPDGLRALMAAGVDVFRLNFSHGSHDTHAAVYRLIRECARDVDRHVAVLQDLSGPKIRTGPLSGDALQLVEGAEIRIGAGEAPSRRGHIFTSYAPLVRSAQLGDRLLLDDGRIELRVTAATDDELQAVVVNGGVLGAHKGINAPGIALAACAVTDKDANDLRFGLQLGVDLVALSFVQTADDIRHACAIMNEAGRLVPVIAKIERPAAVENLDGILQVAEGVMVARGDLGLEMPLEQLPRIQRTILARARSAGRPVILATEVLESMRSEPRPTRAEVSDAANAVLDGADAIMLAGETATGAFPTRAVQTLDAIIRDAESIPPDSRGLPVVDSTVGLYGRALCEAAVTLATTGQASAIVAVTREGRTARLLSSLRPAAPILAVTPGPEAAGRLAVCWGVTPLVSEERDVDRLRAELLRRRLVTPGSVVVFINVSQELDRTDTNFLNLQQLT